MAIKPTFISALLIIAAAIFSCAGKETDEPVEPVVAKEASIPVTAASAAETEPETSKEPSRDLPILKKKEPETVSTRVQEKPGGYEDSWFLVAEVKGERVYTVYVDTKSIENTETGIESWSKLEFQETQRDDDGLSYNEVQIRSSIDCPEKTYAYNTSKFYNSIGQLVYQENITYNRNDITPNTLSAYIAEFVCGDDYEASGE